MSDVETFRRRANRGHRLPRVTRYARVATTRLCRLNWRLNVDVLRRSSKRVSRRLQEIKMAAFIAFEHRNRRVFRRHRVFRDRTHPLEVLDDREVFTRFRFPRHFILELTDEICDDIEFPVRRQGSLTPVLQVLLTLRFYATGTLQNVIGDLFGVTQSTASRTISRVTDALLAHVGEWIVMPNQEKADRNKVDFFDMQGFPNVVGCVDGTQIRIQAPFYQEHEFVNRKNFHSINVQVICDADLKFINVIARWPGSVHDARILRESPLFDSFESNAPPLDGIILGDSGYMLRTWLMTPVQNPETRQETGYNFAHSSTRTTVERSIGVAKQRWQCLRYGLRLQPRKACRVIPVCFMLHNRARHLNLPLPPDEGPDYFDDDDGDAPIPCEGQMNITERARAAAGKAARARIINNCF